VLLYASHSLPAVVKTSPEICDVKCIRIVLLNFVTINMIDVDHVVRRRLTLSDDLISNVHVVNMMNGRPPRSIAHVSAASALTTAKCIVVTD